MTEEVCWQSGVCYRRSDTPDRWNHVPGTNNPADFASRDCASRGLFPLELLDHELWWK